MSSKSSKLPPEANPSRRTPSNYPNCGCELIAADTYKGSSGPSTVNKKRLW